MSVLLYNSFPFHHEMFGFALDYCKLRNLDVDIVNENDHYQWNEMYSNIGYKFNKIKEIDDPKKYKLIIVLTDSDWVFKNEWVGSNTICINHLYTKRNFYIDKQISIGPLQRDRYDDDFILPVFPLIDRNTKVQLNILHDIIITVIGRFVPDDKKYFDFINPGDHNVIYNVISPFKHENLSGNNIRVFSELSANDFMTTLVNSHYILVTDINPNHNKGYSLSSSIHLAFSVGCQLIIPEEMNIHLRLKSPILYRRDRTLKVVFPNYDLVFKERDELISMRNSILDKFFIQ